MIEPKGKQSDTPTPANLIDNLSAPNQQVLKDAAMIRERIRQIICASENKLALLPPHRVVPRDRVNQYQEGHRRSLVETGERALSILAPYGHGLNGALDVYMDFPDDLYYPPRNTPSGTKMEIVLQADSPDNVWFVSFVTQKIPLNDSNNTPKGSFSQRLSSWFSGSNEPYFEVCKRVSFFRANHQNLSESTFHDMLNNLKNASYMSFDPPRDSTKAYCLQFNESGVIDRVSALIFEKYVYTGGDFPRELTQHGMETYSFSPTGFNVSRRYRMRYPDGLDAGRIQKYDLSLTDGFWRRRAVPERNIPAGEIPVDLEVANILERLPTKLIRGFK